MVDVRVTSVIELYQRRLNSKPYVPSATFGSATLGANGVANKLFLTFLFSNSEVGVQFLKDVGLIRSSVVCCKCRFQMSWCVNINVTVTDGNVGGSHILPHALLPRQSGTVHGFSRVTSVS